MTLFRHQAIDHQRRRLWGEVVLTRSLSSWTIVLLVLGITVAIALFLWSLEYKRKESVVGYLVPDKGLVRYFADQGGRLAQLAVTLGEQVNKGQVLGYIRSDKATEAGTSSSEELIASITRDSATIDRLLETGATRKAEEKRLLQDRIRSQESQRLILTEEIALLEDRILLAGEAVAAIEKLASKDNASRTQINERKQALFTYRQNLIATKRQKLSIEEGLSVLKGDLTTFDLKAEEERLTLVSRKEGLVQQLSSMKVSAGHSLVAPADGVVDSLFVAAGQALRPGQAILTIRPDGSILEAHLLVPSRSAGLIKPGQQARLQYDAFPYQRFGIFGGEVIEISDGIAAPGEVPVPVPIEESFYLVILALDSQTVPVAGHPVPLKSGMQLTAYITLESRTLLEWVLDPILSLRGRL